MPSPIARISIGNVIATMAGAENAISGTPMLGNAHWIGDAREGAGDADRDGAGDQRQAERRNCRSLDRAADQECRHGHSGDGDFGHRGAHHSRHVAQDAAGKHAHRDRQRQPGHDARADAHEAECENQNAGDEIGAGDLGDGVLAGQRAQVDQAGNGPGDGNRLPVAQAQADRRDRAAEPDDEHPARRLRGGETELVRGGNEEGNRAEGIPDESGDAGPEGGHVEVAQIRHGPAAGPDRSGMIQGRRSWADVARLHDGLASQKTYGRTAQR